MRIEAHEARRLTIAEPADIVVTEEARASLRGIKPDRFGPFLTTTILFFLAEMADKTQLATVALAARYQSMLLVTTGTTLGMLASDGLAVFLGERLAQRVSIKWIRVGAASLFFAFGAVSGWTAVQSA